jgi:hypothetical protein
MKLPAWMSRGNAATVAFALVTAVLFLVCAYVMTTNF